MKTLKKMLAVFLVIIMLLSSAPLQGFTGLEGIFSTKAEAAVGLGGYYADAAAQWAKNNVGKNTSPILGKGYWNNGGDCANFVSQCLYMGGMDMEKLWNISGYYCHWTTSGYDNAKYAGSWIRVDQLYNYLVAKGATVTENPSASDVSIGDVIIYAASKKSDKTHSAIVTDIVNGVPKIAYHSTGSSYGHTTNWHLNFKGELTFLLKLNGKKCKGGTVKTIDVYTTPKKTYPYLYNAPNGSTISQYLYDTEYGQPEYTHVYQTKTVNNVKWGYTFRYGKWGWIKLSQFTKQGTYSTTSNHSFGGWKTTKSPTCTATGERQRSCSKCGYTQKETLAKVDHKWLNANCTQPKRCSVCNATSGTKLGHDYPSYWTIKTDSKCVEKGVQIKVCRRCGDTLSSSIAEKGHDMGAWYVVKNSTCTEEGLERRDCQRDGCAYYVTRAIPVNPHTYGDEIIVKEPDCVTDGLKKRICINCGNEKFYNYGEPLGHDMGEWYVETPATDDNPGVERSDCSRCDYHETRLIAEHNHEYGEWTVDTAPTCTTNGFRHRICSICLYKQSETLVATGHKVNVVEFGSYPQSKVEDKALISELNALLEDEELISYEYYYGNDEIGSMQQGDYMKYADVELDGERYRYVDIVKARPLTTIANIDNEIHVEADVTIADEFDLYTHSMYSYQRYNNYLPYNISGEISLLSLDVHVHESDEKYWFKFDPIEWRVLNQDTGLVLCETIIDAQPYAATIYANFNETEYFCDEDLTTSVTDYSESNIREWLNSEFYLTAFSEEEQGLILTSDVDGKKDKIYVLSADELTDANNYFDASAENAVSRIAVSSDYAQCQGVLANTTAEDYRIKLNLVDIELVVCGYEEMPEEALNCWWTRTESDAEIGCVRVVNGKGSLVEDNIYNYEYVIDQGVGVRPAMRLDCIEIIRDDKAPTCTEEGYVGDEFCYVCGELISTGHTVDALGHDFVISKNIAPTCLEKGLVEEECTRCGLTQVVDEPAALGHLMGDWYNIKEATCVEEGLKRRDCLRDGCGYYEEDIIPIIPHTPVTVEGYDATCVDDGLTDGEICDFCGTVLVVQKKIDALGHTGLDENGEKVWNRVSDPICSTPGREEVRCTRIINGEKCDHFLEDKEIPALQPLYYESFRKDSTCAEIGYAEYTCIYCNGTVDGHKFGRILDPVEHTMGEWYTVIEAYCVYTGLIRSDCEVCDYYDEQVTDAPYSEHDLTTITVNSTCVEGGHEYKECTRCDYKEGYTDLNPTGHNTVIVPEKSYAPTCTEDGLDFYKCINSGCDYTSEIVIPALEHDWVFVSSVDPTCTESGYDTYECQRDGCDAVDTINTEDALGHNDGQWIIFDKADCTSDGEKELHCTRENNGEICNARIENLHIFMREHNWSNWTVNDATCEEDGIEVRECHNEETDEYDECTATEENILPAINHKWDNGVIDPESTCKLHGTKTYTCQNDSSHTYTETVELNPDNHVGETYIKDEKSATCTEDGYTGDTYCTDCDALLEEGEVIPATKHDWDKWVTVTPATCEEDGLEKRICKNDASHTEENVLPAINHKWDNGVIDPESTCKLHGTKTYTCQNDSSHTYTEAVDLNPDNHVGETYIKDKKSATCTEDGYTGDTYCTDCDALLKEGEAIPATDHDWGKWKVVEGKEPTIYSKGTEIRVCLNNADHTQTRDIDMLESFTAYFIAADENGDFEYEGKTYKLVDDKKFAPGTSIVSPDVPKLEGYTGHWEKYNTSKREDIYVKAIYELKGPENESDLKSDKKVVINNGIATITLSAFAETLNAKVPKGALAYDIILVLDQSNSMTYEFGSNKTAKDDENSRFHRLQVVSKSFIDTVYKNADMYGVDHRIAIVGFSGTESSYKNTGLITPTGKVVTFGKLKDSDYANAFVDVKTKKGNLIQAIEDMDTSAGTAADYGMQMARQILANNQDSDRKKLVVFVTDGEPADNNGRGYNAFSTPIANDTIYFANQIKNKYGAFIYSIGVAAGADPENETKDINKYLHYVSSNYPDATSMTRNGTASAGKNYFLTAEKTEDLDTVFESIIAQKLNNTIDFNKVSFYDTITEYFTLTTENEQALRERAKAEFAISDNDIIVTRNADETTTIVINNIVPKNVYDDNGVQTGFGASIAFDVTANKNTLPGGEYPTNTDEAGVENDGKIVIDFEVPEDKPISTGRAIVEFVIDGETYAIREVAIGDTIVAPEVDNVDWIYTEGTTVTGNYTVIDAEYSSGIREIVWTIGNKTIKQEYMIGEKIIVPEVTAPENMLFVGWSSYVPKRMPEYNLSFTAVFEEHNHKPELVSTTGDCIEGIIYAYACDCGYKYTESDKFAAHNYQANVHLIECESVATMTCTICGKSEEKTIMYNGTYDRKVSNYFNRSESTVVDLTLYNAEDIAVQPDGYIYVKLYVLTEILNSAASGKLNVARVNENGKNDNLVKLKSASEKKEGYYVDDVYLVLKLSHFSYYAIVMPEDAENIPTFEQIGCAFDGGHKYSTKVTAPTCTENGYTTYTCTKCGDSYKADETPVSEHNYKSAVTAPTCTSKGFTTYTCKACGNSYKADEKAALGHNLSAYIVVKSATCTENGSEKASCSRCTYSETRTIKATDHDYKDGICTKCGSDKSKNCSCNCHKGGISGFFFKIILFFQKIFKTNKVCKCGKAHY